MEQREETAPISEATPIAVTVVGSNSSQVAADANPLSAGEGTGAAVIVEPTSGTEQVGVSGTSSVPRLNVEAADNLRLVTARSVEYPGTSLTGTVSSDLSSPTKQEKGKTVAFSPLDAPNTTVLEYDLQRPLPPIVYKVCDNENHAFREPRTPLDDTSERDQLILGKSGVTEADIIYNTTEKVAGVDQLHELNTLFKMSARVKEIRVLDQLWRPVANVPAEPPHLSSINPPLTESHRHGLLTRYMTPEGEAWNGLLDMRYHLQGLHTKVSANANYWIGHIWELIPINMHCGINFVADARNYDAAEPRIIDAFTLLRDEAYPAAKDVAHINMALAHAELPKITDYSYTVHNQLRMIFGTKARMSRLYWRLCVLYVESLVAEERKMQYMVDQAHMTNTPMWITQDDALTTIHNLHTAGENCLFVTRRMMDELNYMRLPSLIYVALSDRYHANFQTFAHKLWPPIHKARLVTFYHLYNENNRNCDMPLRIRARDVARVIDYYARYYGQYALVVEILRTVTSLIMRPSNGKLLHTTERYIIQLPTAALTPTLTLSFARPITSTPFHTNIYSLNKCMWIGCIRRMQIELLWRTVLDAYGAGALYSKPRECNKSVWKYMEWLNTRGEFATEGYCMAQSIALRMGWGVVLNAMEALQDVICLMKAHQANLQSGRPILQWADWLPFSHAMPVTAGVLGHVANVYGQELPKQLAIPVEDHTDAAYGNGITGVMERFSLPAMTATLMQHGRYYCCGWLIVERERCRDRRVLWHQKPRKQSGILCDGQTMPWRTNNWSYARRLCSLQAAEDVAAVVLRAAVWRSTVWIISTRVAVDFSATFESDRPPIPDVMVHSPLLNAGLGVNPALHDKAKQQPAKGVKYHYGASDPGSESDKSRTVIGAGRAVYVADKRDADISSSSGRSSSLSSGSSKRSEVVMPKQVKRVQIGSVERSEGRASRPISMLYDSLATVRSRIQRVVEMSSIEEANAMDAYDEMWNIITNMCRIEANAVDYNTIFNTRAQQFVQKLALTTPESLLAPRSAAVRPIYAALVADMCDTILQTTAYDRTTLRTASVTYRTLDGVFSLQAPLTASDFLNSGQEETWELFGRNSTAVVQLMLQMKDPMEYIELMFNPEGLRTALVANGIISATSGTLQAQQAEQSNGTCRDEARNGARGRHDHDDDAGADGTGGGEHGNGTPQDGPGNNNTGNNGGNNDEQRPNSGQNGGNGNRRSHNHRNATGSGEHSTSQDASSTCSSEKPDKHKKGKKGKMVTKIMMRAADTACNSGLDQASDDEHHAVRERLCHAVHKAAAQGKTAGGSPITNLVERLQHGELIPKAQIEKLIDNFTAGVKMLETAPTTGESINQLGMGRITVQSAELDEFRDTLMCRASCPLGLVRKYATNDTDMSVAESLLPITQAQDGTKTIAISDLLALRRFGNETQCQALMMRLPGSIPCEQLAGYFCPSLSLEANPEMERGYDVSRLLDHRSYKNAPEGLRNIFQIEARWVVEIARDCVRDRLPVLWTVYQANSELYSYELAALMMWWSILPEPVYAHFLHWNWHQANVNRAGARIATLCSYVRMCGVGCVCEHGIEIAHFLRKFGNLKGRRLGEADWEAEAAHSSLIKVMRTYGNQGGRWDRRQYLDRMQHILDVLIGKVVNKRCATRMTKLDEWWARRQQQLPSGSTSERQQWLQTIKAEGIVDPSGTKTDRPNKKAAAEALPSDYMWNVLKSTPIMSERPSTKMEPGPKQRALHACSDEATYVASYVSEGIEKAMSGARAGLMPLQEPADVADWLSWHDRENPRAVLLSLDYKDFNKEHSLSELIMIQLLFAKAFNNAPGGYASQAKALSALWLAHATQRRIMRPKHGKHEAMTNGLWSGARDTARDNTLLNRAYIQLASEWLDANYNEWGQVTKIATCGDDSVIQLTDTVSAAVLMGVMGEWWNLNPKKQMCGYGTSEFLQRMPHETRGACGSVCSMIAAMCSGQWYKARGPSQDTAIDAICSQCYELGLRAGNTAYTRYLAVRALDAYMRTDAKSTESGEKEKLEWFSFRHSVHKLPQQYGLFNEPQFTLNSHPLWSTPEELRKGGAAGKPSPPAFYVEENTAGLPGQATADFIQHERDQLLDSEKQVLDAHAKTLTRTYKAQSFGAMHHATIAQLRQHDIADNWPRRTAESATYADMHREADRVEEQWQRECSTEDRRKMTRELVQQASRLKRSKTVIDENAAVAKFGIEPRLAKILQDCGETRITYWVDRMVARKSVRTWANLLSMDLAWVATLDPALRAICLGSTPST